MNGAITQPLVTVGKKFLSLRQIDDMGGLNFLLQPFIQANVLSALVGESDVGKSTFARQIAVCVAAGKQQCAGFELNVANSAVLYCALEENKSNVKLAFMNQAKELDIEPEEILDNIVIVSEPEDLLKTVTEAFVDQTFGLIIIDPYSAAIASAKHNNTNNDADVRKYLNPFKALCEKQACALIWIHHNRKPSGNTQSSKHNITGTQAFEAAMRNVIELKAVNAEAGQFAIVILKGNDNTPEEKKTNYTLDRSGFVFNSTGQAATLTNARHKQRNEESAAKDKQIAELLSSGKTQNDVAKQVRVSLSRVSAIARVLNDQSITTTTIP